jgi:hypothetical protein
MMPDEPTAATPESDPTQQSQQRSASGARPRAGIDPEHVQPNSPRVLAGFLVSYEGNSMGTYWPIYQGRSVVGRKDAAQGLDIQIDHPTTSSRHAVLLAAARPGRIKLEDTGSTNGTFLGERRLEAGKPHELDDGDVLRFGGFPVLVKIV